MTVNLPLEPSSYAKRQRVLRIAQRICCLGCTIAILLALGLALLLWTSFRLPTNQLISTHVTSQQLTGSELVMTWDIAVNITNTWSLDIYVDRLYAEAWFPFLPVEPGNNVVVVVAQGVLENVTLSGGDCTTDVRIPMDVRLPLGTGWGLQGALAERLVSCRESLLVAYVIHANVSVLSIPVVVPPIQSETSIPCPSLESLGAWTQPIVEKLENAVGNGIVEEAAEAGQQLVEEVTEKVPKLDTS